MKIGRIDNFNKNWTHWTWTKPDKWKDTDSKMASR